MFGIIITLNNMYYFRLFMEIFNFPLIALIAACVFYSIADTEIDFIMLIFVFFGFLAIIEPLDDYLFERQPDTKPPVGLEDVTR